MNPRSARVENRFVLSVSLPMRIKDGSGTTAQTSSPCWHGSTPHFWPRMQCIPQIFSPSSPLSTQISDEGCVRAVADGTKPRSQPPTRRSLYAPCPRPLSAPPSRNLLLMSAHQSFAAPSAPPPPPPIWTKRTKTCRTKPTGTGNSAGWKMCACAHVALGVVWVSLTECRKLDPMILQKFHAPNGHFVHF